MLDLQAHEEAIAAKELTNSSSWDVFQWLGSDSWADRLDVVEGVERYAAGSLSLRIHSPPVPDFRTYYFGLNPYNNTRNPWFREFWEEKFNCSFRDSPRLLRRERECPPSHDIKVFNKLEADFEPDPKLIQVVNAIHTVARGLHALYILKCAAYNHTKGLCPEMRPLNGTELYNQMLKVDFTDQSKERINFDQRGDPPARYPTTLPSLTSHYSSGGQRLSQLQLSHFNILLFSASRASLGELLSTFLATHDTGGGIEGKTNVSQRGPCTYFQIRYSQLPRRKTRLRGDRHLAHRNPQVAFDCVATWIPTTSTYLSTPIPLSSATSPDPQTSHSPSVRVFSLPP